MSREPPELASEITLRDYLAAKAMQGLVDDYAYEIRESDKTAVKSERTGFDDRRHGPDGLTFAESMAQEAYIIADAMLRMRDSTCLNQRST